jgi:hypothetical protein
MSSLKVVCPVGWLVAVALALAAQPAVAQPPAVQPGPLVALGLLEPTIPPGLTGQTVFGYSPVWAPPKRVEDQDARLGSVRQDTRGMFPIYLNGPDVLLGSLTLRNTEFQTDAVLTDSRRPFPGQLWDVGAGLTYLRDLCDGWSAGGVVTVGSRSDRPFNSVHELYPSAIAFLRVPAGGNDAWQYSVSYVPASLLPFPIPGVAYEWNPTDRLQVALGVPFSLVWKPTDTLRFDLGYLPPQSVRAQLTWQATPRLGVFGGFEWVNDTYLLAGRPDRDDRFFSLEKRLPIGLRWTPGPGCALDLAGGYAFDRLYYTARNFTEQGRDRVEVAPGGFLMLRLALQY